jgi:DNA-3-methyladenine glycosylase
VPAGREFFERPGPEVAPELLGWVIEHETPAGLVAVRLTEVEAYAGEDDPASHAYRGRTARTAVMFGPAGHAYVYFTYGMHYCVNLVCLPEGTASAVLLRAGRVVAGEELARARRASRLGAAPRAAPGSSGAGDSRAGTLGRGPGGPREGTAPARPRGVRGAAPPGDDRLARGPARLCVALGIDRALDGADVCDPASPLRVRPAPGTGAPGGGDGGEARGTVRSGPRTGVSRAAEVQWRFWVDGEPTVSAYRPYVPRRRAPDQTHI